MKASTMFLALLPLASVPMLSQSNGDQAAGSASLELAPDVETGEAAPEPSVDAPRRALSAGLTHRHTPVIAGSDVKAHEILLHFTSEVDQSLSDPEFQQVLDLMESSLAYSSKELAEIRARQELQSDPAAVVELLEVSLEYTRAAARLDAFHSGLYAVMEIRRDRQPMAFSYPQVRAFHMRPFGNRSVVVLVDESPFSDCGLALRAYREASERLAASDQSAFVED